MSRRAIMLIVPHIKPVPTTSWKSFKKVRKVQRPVLTECEIE
jgi:hypothetical protein